MPNEDYRAEQSERREHGLKARHEQRLENATYTAAEVKVLTEAALRLGRKEAGEEIAAACEALYIPVHNVGGAEPIPSDPTEWDEALHEAAILARQIGAQPSPGATSGRTDPEEGA